MVLIEVNGKIRRLSLAERGQSKPSFALPYNIRWTLGGECSIIRLNDGRRLVIRRDQAGLLYNDVATRTLRDLSAQFEAEVRGVAVLCSLSELGVTKHER
jgi:hypothetical protein